jgi:hypothetical protein
VTGLVRCSEQLRHSVRHHRPMSRGLHAQKIPSSNG